MTSNVFKHLCIGLVLCFFSFPANKCLASVDHSSIGNSPSSESIHPFIEPQAYTSMHGLDPINPFQSIYELADLTPILDDLNKLMSPDRLSAFMSIYNDLNDCLKNLDIDPATLPQQVFLGIAVVYKPIVKSIEQMAATGFLPTQQIYALAAKVSTKLLQTVIQTIAKYTPAPQHQCLVSILRKLKNVIMM